MTPRCLPFFGSPDAKRASVAGSPGFTRVRSGLIFDHVWPPSRVAKTTLRPRYSVLPSTRSHTSGLVRSKRYVLRSYVGETSRVCPVRSS